MALMRHLTPSSLLSVLRAAVPHPLLAIGIVPSVLMACTDSVGPGADAAGPLDLILFVSDREGVVGSAGERLSDIFSVLEDGTGVRNLTHAPAKVYRELSLSPGGPNLVFESDRIGCYNIWVMNVDGTEPLQLTGGSADRCNEMPRWSPDGSRIAFTTSRETIDRSWEVYVMASDGSDPHNVSDNGGSGATGWDFPIGWSPDGKVVFSHVDAGAPITFTVSPDGSSLAPLPILSDGYAAFWSPKGGRVAFMTGQPGEETISIMNADGTGLAELTAAPGGDSFDPGYRANSYQDPWSPDGSMLAFVSQRDGNPEVYVASADGTGVVNVSSHPGADRFDGWSPDGSRLVFSSDRSGSWDVYIVHRDGTGLRSLTDSPATEWRAVWVDG